MNKDQKLLAEAYENILKEANLKAMSPKERDAYEAELDKKESYKNYLAGHNNESDSLDSTVDLEAIADFLNQNNVWSGAPAKGSGGWFVHNSEVVNDDAEGGHSGISIRILPEKNGLVFYNKLRGSDNYIKTLISWPVNAKDVEGYMQQRSAELWGDEDAESISNDFIKQIERKAGKHDYFIGETDNGELYAIIVEYDRYSDGDRWIDEENYYYQVEGEERGKYIPDKQAKELIKQIAINNPELNKHVYSEILDQYKEG